ncbi:MAG: DUF1080 domain-containing protein [Bryobacteraceae bacterium]
MKRALILLLLAGSAGIAQDDQPRYVDPGPPPSDAVVLFNGKDVSEWVHRSGKPAAWPVKDGAMVCSTGSGDLYTKRKLASAQIHVEFSTPYMPDAKDQARGNSGVYLQSRYEIQILDSFRNPTYPNGAAGALYGQYAPLVNASLKPGEWQAYDIVFHAPQCADGKVTRPGTLTVFFNGVLVQDHVTIKGPTAGADRGSVCEPGPLMLQDHYHPDVKETPMRFRNIWYRPLE